MHPSSREVGLVLFKGSAPEPHVSWGLPVLLRWTPSLCYHKSASAPPRFLSQGSLTPAPGGGPSFEEPDFGAIAVGLITAEGLCWELPGPGTPGGEGQSPPDPALGLRLSRPLCLCLCVSLSLSLPQQGARAGAQGWEGRVQDTTQRLGGSRYSL